MLAQTRLPLGLRMCRGEEMLKVYEHMLEDELRVEVHAECLPLLFDVVERLEELLDRETGGERGEFMSQIEIVKIPVRSGFEYDKVMTQEGEPP